MSGPKILSAEEIKMRAEAEERLRLVQDQFRKAEVLRRKMSEIENVQLILTQVAEQPQAKGISSQLSSMTRQCQRLCDEWESLATTTDNAKLRKYNTDLQQLIVQVTEQLKPLQIKASKLRDDYVKALIEKIPQSNVRTSNLPQRQFLYFERPDVPDNLVIMERDRLLTLIQSIQDRAGKIHAIPDTDYSALRKKIESILGSRKRENVMIYQELHQFDVQTLQGLLRKLEDAEYEYDKLDTELSRELAAYHAVCKEYGIAPQQFAFRAQSVQDIRYATADILQKQGFGFHCAETMARVRQILSGMGYTYLGDKEEERQVFRQIYRIHDKTILHVIYDSSGRVTMEVAIEDDEEREASGREVQQIVNDQGIFCQSFEQIFAYLNADGMHMKKEILCPCGEEFAQIIDISGFTMEPEVECTVDYSMYESPEAKYLQMR